MGADLFINYSCPYRKDEETTHLQNLLRLQRQLDRMERSSNPARTVRVRTSDGVQVKEQVYTHADLKMASAKLSEVHTACETCPANLKRAFGIRGTIGCHAHVTAPMDDFAERILFETLAENAKPERATTEQSNLVRALFATTPASGEQWRSMSPNKSGPRSNGLTRWGSRPVPMAIDGITMEVTVHALAEMLFLFPALPARAVDDILSFFRSFFAVVAVYVSTPDGQLDPRRNAQFWARSRALNELNLYIQLLKHAARLGQGTTSAPS